MKARLECSSVLSQSCVCVVCVAGVVSTIPDTSDVKAIGYWMDPFNQCEWLVLRDSSGFGYRNLTTTPNSQAQRQRISVDDLYDTLPFVVFPRTGRIVYSDDAFGLSTILPSETESKVLSDPLTPPDPMPITPITGLAISGNRVVAVSQTSIHFISAGSDPLLIESSDSLTSFSGCAFGDWIHPTLFVASQFGGDILVLGFESECPAEVKSISPFWPLITSYCSGQFRRTLKPNVRLKGNHFSVCVTPSRHLIVASNVMCSLFAIDIESGETVRIAGTGLWGAADGPSHAATFTAITPLWGPPNSLVLVVSEKCVYVTSGSGVRRVTLNPKYFLPRYI